MALPFHRFSSPRRTAAASAAALLLLLAGCSASEPDGSDSEDAGAAGETGGEEASAEVALAAGAPDFTAETVEGEEFEAAELAGTPAVYWFWTPWCTICFGEAGGLRDAAEEYEGQAEFVGVAAQGEVDQMQAFIADTGIDNFPQIADEDGEVWADFGVVGQPSFVFVTPGGGTELVPGSLPEEELAERIEELTG